MVYCLGYPETILTSLLLPGGCARQLARILYLHVADSLGRNPKYIDGTQDLQAQVTLIANLWLIGMEGVGNATFNGSANSIHNLVGLIAEGVYLNPALVGAVEMRAQIEKPIYAIMIPATWNYNDNPAQGSKAVFILSTEYDCKNSEECPERPPGYPSGLDSFMTSDAAQQTCYCYGGKWFFLLQVKGYAYTCGFGIGSNCNDPNKLVAPKGLDAFDGKSWGGLTKHHLVQGYVASLPLRCYLSVLFFLRPIAQKRDAN